MEKTQIVKYLHHPETMTEASLEKTRTLTVDYPWFQTGWILYLKNLKNIYFWLSGIKREITPLNQNSQK